MTNERFNELIDQLEANRAQILKDRQAIYASKDALHNFRIGARIDNSTMAKTAWHYCKKHMVSLLDRIERDDWSNLNDTLEKITDIMNYLDFIWCIANDQLDESAPQCLQCKYYYSDELDPLSKCHYCRRSTIPTDQKYGVMPLLYEPKN